MQTVNIYTTRRMKKTPFKRVGWKRKVSRKASQTSHKPQGKEFGVKTTDTLQRKLDTLFSRFIRQRDADKNGLIRCCACGVLVPWEDSDNSHFVSRQYLYTRYDERNCHASCRKCNRFLEGNKESYSLFLIRKYGPNIFEELNAKKWLPYPNFPYEEKIKHYKSLVL